MFRFWASDSRGSDKTVVDDRSSMFNNNIPKPLPSDTREIASTSDPAIFGRPPKRRRSTVTDHHPADTRAQAPTKRTRIGCDHARPQGSSITPNERVTVALEEAIEVIQYQFGLEILLKHDELRLIDQELAKCQIALEQLRRCHLIPYPTSCPTPQQMMEVSSGKGLALQKRYGEPVPQWAPPFGIADGPYARHYAKWLIPDPIFDGSQAGWQPLPEHARGKVTVDGRATRNASSNDGFGFGRRPVRGATGQKLHALSAGYPQTKDKNGPCILKRSDGQTVKLVCNDCHRENFSSTQGFINHCRIAHRKEFKSHEEAAVHCGHPIDVDETRAGVGSEDGAAGLSLVHPLARNERVTDQQAYVALLSRIDASLKLFHEGKHPHVTSIPGAPAKPDVQNSKFAGSSNTPYLSRLLQMRKFDGNLDDHVTDAKTQDDMEIDDSADESDDAETPVNGHVTSPVPLPSIAAVRTPAVMRVPARTSIVPLPTIPNSRPTSKKGQAPAGLAGATTMRSTTAAPAEKEEVDSVMYDEEDLDTDLSPNTLAGNNAPSLVSDDGEYDDSSDDGSTAGTSEEEEMEATSVSDVAEITLDDEQHEAPRDLRHHRASAPTAVKLKKDEAKHVTFMSPVTANGPGPGRGRGRRKQKA